MRWFECPFETVRSHPLCHPTNTKTRLKWSRCNLGPLISCHILFVTGFVNHSDSCNNVFSQIASSNTDVRISDGDSMHGWASNVVVVSFFSRSSVSIVVNELFVTQLFYAGHAKQMWGVLFFNFLNKHEDTLNQHFFSKSLWTMIAMVVKITFFLINVFPTSPHIGYRICFHFTLLTRT